MGLVVDPQEVFSVARSLACFWECWRGAEVQGCCVPPFLPGEKTFVGLAGLRGAGENAMRLQPPPSDVSWGA